MQKEKQTSKISNRHKASRNLVAFVCDNRDFGVWAFWFLRQARGIGLSATSNGNITEKRKKRKKNAIPPNAGSANKRTLDEFPPI
jgi:hypothetical protein